jgi:hypothetical protein
MPGDEREELVGAIESTDASLRAVKAEAAKLRAELAMLPDGTGRSPIRGVARARAVERGWCARSWIVWRVLAVATIALLMGAGWCGLQWRTLRIVQAEATPWTLSIEERTERRAWLEEGLALLREEIATARGPAPPSQPPSALGMMWEAKRAREGEAAEPSPDAGTDVPIWAHVAVASCVMKRGALARRAVREIERINPTSPSLREVAERCREAHIVVEE